MHLSRSILSFIAFSMAVAAPHLLHGRIHNTPRSVLERVFAQPRDSVLTGIYYYWINGQVTPEGVASDIRAMKAQGINRAFFGSMGLTDMPNMHPGVPIMSPQWWATVHAALKTATEQGVQIGIFNCPGWSQAGGPWIAPEQSMRYLGSQRQEVTGNGDTKTVTFATPKDFLNNVKVLAYPSRGFTTFTPANANIATSGFTPVQALFDADTVTKATIDPYNASVTFKLPHATTLRSLRVRPGNEMLAYATLLAADSAGVMRPIGNYTLDRSNIDDAVGYDRLADVAIALPDIFSDTFVLRIDSITPEATISEIRLSDEPVVDDYTRQTLSKMHQTPHPLWTDYKWATPVNYTSRDGIVTPDEVLDLTSYIQGDTLVYAFPRGEWTVTRTYMAPTGIFCAPTLPGDGRGFEVDRWNHDALMHHYDSYIGQILKRIPPQDRATFNTIVSDSYERATQNWGDDFHQYFTKHYGYDPTPYMLTYDGVVVGDADRSNRFLWDVRRMIADRLANDHIRALSQRAHRDGLKTWLEGYGHWGFPGEFMQYGGASDETAGEFWSTGTLGDIENRAASSTAHAYGKDICWAESFTVGGLPFVRSPRGMKRRGDRFFTEGINGTLFHLAIAQLNNDELPGQNAWFGNEFNRKNTWYSHLHLFTDYLKRCNYLLQQGNYVADVAYYIGEDCPVMYGITEPALPPGHQFDFINADILRDSLRADATHSMTLPYDNKYRLLVLPPTTAMRPSVLKAVKNLLEEGGVVLSTVRPDHSPSLQDFPHADAEVQTLAQELWGDMSDRGVRNIGRGLLFHGYGIQDVFDALGVIADFRPLGADSVLYAHVTEPGRDIYFLSNQTDHPVEFDGVFRVAGRRPEFFNPLDGTWRQASAYTHTDATTHVPMRLDEDGSIFVVFEQPSDPATRSCDVEANFPTRSRLLALDGPWDIELQDMFGATTRLPQTALFDLATSPRHDIKFFSGTATYRHPFTLTRLPEDPVTLSLGRVGEMATVKVNGQDVGGAWTGSNHIDVTDALRPGHNVVEVTVVNNWHNRLIGDKNLPEAERHTVVFNNPYHPDDALQPSGLIGPVELLH